MADRSSDEEVYGLVERQVAFKLLAAHAMVDAEFYRQLREDPEIAAAQLHIRLNDEDVRYIRESVQWNVLDEHADAVRAALNVDEVVRSIW
jgi:predicted mannosyl-3-phosphoglycerate phosphatase (HAD superfamily)